MNWKIVSLIVGLLILAVVGFLGRYDIIGVPAGGEGHQGVAYRLDRWTGEVVFIYVDDAEVVEIK